jgi:prevent-host-death family protein
MRHKYISVSQAKAKLLEIAREVNEQGAAYMLTKDGTPIGVIVPLEDYEALVESDEVFSNPALMGLLNAALDDESKGRLWSRDKSGRWQKKASKKKSA